MPKKNVEFNSELSYRDNLREGFRPAHRPGSRKQRIADKYAADGEQAAAVYAKRLGVKESTFKAWSADWRIMFPRAKRSEKPVSEIFAGRASKARKAKGRSRKRKSA